MQFVRISARQLKEFVATFGRTDELAVNNKIGFYEPCELAEWMKKPKENLLYSTKYGGKYVGFVFAKIMSPHWALIDTFYVKPDMRKFGVGRFMQNNIDAAIKKMGVKYISRVTREDNAGMHKFLGKLGYSKRDTYAWFDKFL